MIGRLMALVAVVSSGFVPLSLAIFGILVGAGLPIRALILFAGGFIIIAAIVFLLVFRRSGVIRSAITK